MHGSEPDARFPHTHLTRLIASHTLASLVLESLKDLDYDCVAEQAVYRGERNASIRIYCRKRVREEDLEEVTRFIEGKTRVRLDAEILEEPAHSLLGSSEHLKEAARKFLDLIKVELKPLLRDKHEHALAILWSGDPLIMRGSEKRIYIVGSMYAALAHTHPSGLCIPSHHDIRSIADQLADGACCEAIVSLTCVFLVYRIDTLLLEDYDALHELARKLSKLKDFEKYLETLTYYSSLLKTVRIRLKNL